MTLPELLLWRELRRQSSGFKFRRQHPAGPYTADFYCHEARLIVEVDGQAHGRGDRPAKDSARDAWFDARRFAVLRLPATAVLRDLEAAHALVIQTARERIARSPESKA
ncbi:MAG: hypothetical protein A4S12_08325 [Proteobacteria bacterium SG_bin5]|nr:endonuclease domain-containing protein [Sphingomonas sp.]OQW41574.1 MAG: hypothetical protein A4S12_08325 [Proteobacteria bacterium SG_bin5]